MEELLSYKVYLYNFHSAKIPSAMGPATWMRDPSWKSQGSYRKLLEQSLMIIFRKMTCQKITIKFTVDYELLNGMYNLLSYSVEE